MFFLLLPCLFFKRLFLKNVKKRIVFKHITTFVHQQTHNLQIIVKIIRIILHKSSTESAAATNNSSREHTSSLRNRFGGAARSWLDKAGRRIIFFFFSFLSFSENTFFEKSRIINCANNRPVWSPKSVLRRKLLACQTSDLIVRFSYIQLKPTLKEYLIISPGVCISFVFFILSAISLCVSPSLPSCSDAWRRDLPGLSVTIEVEIFWLNLPERYS